MRARASRKLRPGDTVRIRGLDEVLATLDDAGQLRHLPFMPEMLPYCGTSQRVFRRAHKTCDSVLSPAMRRMDGTVFLAGLRCDGSAHGGCQARCLFFWREEWLTPATGVAGNGARPGHGPPVDVDVGRCTIE